MVDASVCATWLLPDESHPLADRVFEEEVRSGILVPALFAYEVANILAIATRKGRLSDEGRQSAQALLGRIRITSENAPPIEALVGVALRHGLSGYDAAYLDLAHRHGTRLATLDGRLAAAARSIGCAYQ